MSENPSDLPVPGIEAFTIRSKSGFQSRAAQLLAMTTFAMGSPEQIAAISADAKRLNVPVVEPFSGAEFRWDDQRFLDQITKIALRDHGQAPAPEDWYSLWPAKNIDELNLWKALRESSQPTLLLALLNLSLGSVSEIQRTAAAVCLHAVSRGEMRVARGILHSGLSSSSPTIVEMSRAALGLDLFRLSDDLATGPQMDPTETDRTVSVAVHGTWARLVANEDRWYAPQSKLHRHVRSQASANLFSGEGYYRWSGGYTAAERAEGADDLTMWRHLSGIREFDVVYAHSHGGNVALGAASQGEKIRLLVLMHTPALRRSPDEWERIRANVGRVLVLRTRMDLVVLADGLANGSSQSFDSKLLPHRELELHWQSAKSWFSHDRFLKLSTWVDYDVAGQVRYERAFG